MERLVFFLVVQPSLMTNNLTGATILRDYLEETKTDVSLVCMEQSSCTLSNGKNLDLFSIGTNRYYTSKLVSSEVSSLFLHTTLKTRPVSVHLKQEELFKKSLMNISNWVESNQYGVVKIHKSHAYPDGVTMVLESTQKDIEYLQLAEKLTL